ncbi:hypothetical protein ACOCJ5_16555 [Knoellia sp. CPCC 206450]|uniref:hypothetical protein n=1 Tax=Knoellia tibetensis TaxID=3404798 RepID=UPI003B4279D4
MTKVPYVSGPRAGIPSPDELRARIPGWGADLDPADRPSVPQELDDGRPDGVAWDFPEEQVTTSARERSIEHARLTPVFGTVAPLTGLPGAVRRRAYSRYSEARAAHWLLLLGADRIESKQHLVRSMFSRRPDNPVEETGIRSELTGHGIASRRGHGRVDRHQVLDPVIVSLPAILAGWAAVRTWRRVRG